VAIQHKPPTALKVICINDKDRPNVIPTSKWVKKDEWYTVTKLMKCNVQGGLLGFQLAEIDLKGCCSPYEYFAVHRFGIPIPEDGILNEVVEEEIVI
jgi:hypothetical protein